MYTVYRTVQCRIACEYFFTIIFRARKYQILFVQCTYKFVQCSKLFFSVLRNNSLNSIYACYISQRNLYQLILILHTDTFISICTYTYNLLIPHDHFPSIHNRIIQLICIIKTEIVSAHKHHLNGLEEKCHTKMFRGKIKT